MMTIEEALDDAKWRAFSHAYIFNEMLARAGERHMAAAMFLLKASWQRENYSMTRLAKAVDDSVAWRRRRGSGLRRIASRGWRQ